MAYFDFANTPITSDLTLKARWCCPEPTCETAKHPSLFGLQCKINEASKLADALVGVYAVGNEIPDTYDGVSNPWIICGASPEAPETLLILRKFVNDDPYQIATTPTVTDTTSLYANLTNYFENEYFSKCSKEFQEVCGKAYLDGIFPDYIGLPYNSTMNVNDFVLPYFADSVVSYTNVGNPSAKRAATKADGTPTSYWVEAYQQNSGAVQYWYNIKPDGGMEITTRLNATNIPWRMRCKMKKDTTARAMDGVDPRVVEK